MSVQLQLLEEKQMKDRKRGWSQGVCQANRGAALLECVSNSAARWGIRGPADFSALAVETLHARA